MNLTRRGFLGASLQVTAAYFAAATVGIAAPAVGSGAGRSAVFLYRPDQKGVADGALKTWREFGFVNSTALMLSDALLFDAASLRKVLLDRRGSRIVAVGDACDTILLTEALRDVRGRIMLRGIHAEGAASSTHTLQTYGATRGCGGAVSCMLNASGHSAWVRETTLGSSLQPIKRGGRYSTRDMREALGGALAVTAIDIWKPVAAGATTSLPQGENSGIQQTFMSLIADV